MKKPLIGLLAAALLVVACSPLPENGPSESPQSSEPSSATTTQPPTAQTPSQRLPWGPTQADVDAATEVAAELSDEDLAGLVIVARYDGTVADVPATMMRELALGGIILFSPNVEGLAQVQQTAERIQEVQAELGREWPGIVAVDNEGGTVQRLSGERGPWTTFPAFAGAETADRGVVREAMAAMGRELRASGINTNYAPVADVTGPKDVTIRSRAASSDPDVAARAVVEAVEGFADAGIMSSVKHFPGHGSLGTDSHVGLPVQNSTMDRITAHDLPPFTAGIAAGVPMVMVGHIAVSEWDEEIPASLSPQAYTYLREDLGFTGVTITDGLDMGALTWDSAEIAVRAMVAGSDILLTPANPAEAREGLLDALADGALARERLQEAAGRIIAMMQYQEELAERSGPVSDADVGASQSEADALGE